LLFRFSGPRITVKKVLSGAMNHPFRTLDGPLFMDDNAAKCEILVNQIKKRRERYFPAPTRQMAPTPSAPATSPQSGGFLGSMAGGLIGGMIGGMLFRSLGFGGDNAVDTLFTGGDCRCILFIHLPPGKTDCDLG
jgi:hypothetical protein